MLKAYAERADVAVSVFGDRDLKASLAVRTGRESSAARGHGADEISLARAVERSAIAKRCRVSPDDGSDERSRQRKKGAAAEAESRWHI